mgnify:CR=1 FL=1
MPSDIDETPQKSEHPRSLAKRLSKGKAEVASRRLRELDYGPATVLAADTVVSVGRQIMPKAELAEDALANLRTLSGRTHRVYTGVCVIGPTGALRQRLIETRVRFKRLSRLDIQSYLASDEWRGKAGGYAIQGLAGGFVVRLVGSYTNVVGLPLAETLALLSGEGYDIHASWRAPHMLVADEADELDDEAGERRSAGSAHRRSFREDDEEPLIDADELLAAEADTRSQDDDHFDDEGADRRGEPEQDSRDRSVPEPVSQAAADQAAAKGAMTGQRPPAPAMPPRQPANPADEPGAGRSKAEAEGDGRLGDVPGSPDEPDARPKAGRHEHAHVTARNREDEAEGEER